MDPLDHAAPAPDDDELPDPRKLDRSTLEDLAEHVEGFGEATQEFLAVRARALAAGPANFDVKEIAGGIRRRSDWTRVALELAQSLGVYDPAYHTEGHGMRRATRIVRLARNVGVLPNIAKTG